MGNANNMKKTDNIQIVGDNDLEEAAGGGSTKYDEMELMGCRCLYCGYSWKCYVPNGKSVDKCPNCYIRKAGYCGEVEYGPIKE